MEINDDLISLNDIFGILFQDDFALSFNEIITKSKDNNNFEKSLVYILKSTYKINQKYSLTLNNLDSLILNIHNCTMVSRFIPNSNHILFDRNKLYIEKMELRFPEFTSDAYKFLEEYLILIDGRSSPLKVNFLMYVLLTVWENLIPQLYEKFDKIKVLVISIYNHNHAKSIKNQLELFFSFFIDIDLCTKEYIDLDYIESCEYDLIITDSDLPPKLSKARIRIHGNHSLKDYKYIVDTLYDMMNRKNKYIK